MELVALASLALLAVGVRRSWLPPAATLAILVTIAGLLLGASIGRDGVDPIRFRAAHLLVALAGLAWLAVPQAARATGGERRRDEFRFLVLLGLAALLTHLSFLSFHGFGRWIHQHDVAHYYLGSKYFEELGYGRLYVGALRAEAQTHGGFFRAASARDLASGELRPVPELLGESAAVERRFAPERWREFRVDVEWFRNHDPSYDRFLADYGFNPTPAWALLGGALANLVPAGSERGILLLTLLDAVLLVALGAAAAKTFGARTAGLAAVLFCVVAGATFDWVGGAFLRYLWFAATGFSICLLRGGRPGAAGVALGLAAALRVFPALLVWPFAVRWLRRRGGLRGAAGSDARFLAGFFVAVGGIVGATLLAGGGTAAWVEFSTNLRNLAAQAATNDVGSAALLRSAGLDGTVLGSGLQVALLVLVALGSAIAAPRLEPPAALLLGVPVVFFAVTVSSYYWCLLALVALVLGERSRGPVAALFGLEAVSWLMLLVGASTPAMIAVRNSSLAALLLGALLALMRSPGAHRTAVPVTAPATRPGD